MMDLTNEDVTDILALLDSLPYDELDLQTSRFRLRLRRTPDGWTQAVEARAVPTVVDVSPAARLRRPRRRSGGSGGPGGRSGGPAAAAGAAAAGGSGAATPRGGPDGHGNRPNVPSGRR